MIKTTYPPSILQYIPFFFVIWSDDLLTLSEIAVVKKIIDDDQNLSEKDRETLNSWLNTAQPPLDTEIKSWQRAISNSGIKLVEGDNHPLTSFSKKLISQNGSEHVFNEDLSAIETNLGIQPNHYHHLFEVEVVLEKTSNFYDPKEIDQIFKGTNHREIDEFREALSNSIFSWEIIKNKENFREKVLTQVQYLSLIHI